MARNKIPRFKSSDLTGEDKQGVHLMVNRSGVLKMAAKATTSTFY